MKQIEVTALKMHSPDGIHRYQIGDSYKISETSAKFLMSVGFVKAKARTVEAEAEPEKEVKESKRYHRRDMRVED